MNVDEIGRVTSVKELTNQICQICGDEIEFTVDGEPFVACKECAFPICRPCYEYERRERSQACPKCKTQFKRIKGAPKWKEMKTKMNLMIWRMNLITIATLVRFLKAVSLLALTLAVVLLESLLHHNWTLQLLNSEIPLLTYGKQDETISADKLALIIPPYVVAWKMSPPRAI